MSKAQRKFWGWGTEEQTVTPEEREFLAAAFAKRFKTAFPTPVAPPKVEDIALRAPRLPVPSNLQRSRLREVILNLAPDGTGRDHLLEVRLGPAIFRRPGPVRPVDPLDRLLSLDTILESQLTGYGRRDETDQ